MSPAGTRSAESSGALGIKDISLGDTPQLSAGREHPILDPGLHGMHRVTTSGWSH